MKINKNIVIIVLLVLLGISILYSMRLTYYYSLLEKDTYGMCVIANKYKNLTFTILQDYGKRIDAESNGEFEEINCSLWKESMINID